MLKKKTIQEVELAGKRVFIRVDFNVPLNEDGSVREDTRIRESLPTIQWALDQQARVILASHLGRPKGKPNPKYSLRSVADRLSQLLARPVTMASDCIGDEVEALVSALQPGQIVLLENLRFHAGEEENSADFSQQLAKLADVVVNDAFGTAHRGHASNYGITQFVRPAVAGLLMAKEIYFYNQGIKNPNRPVAVILGGSKISTKIGVIEALAGKVDAILIGGAMAFTFYKAMGKSVGNSLVEDDMQHVAIAAMEMAKRKNTELLLPIDVVAAQSLEENSKTIIVAADNIPDGWMGLDIGPASVQHFISLLQNMRTIVWNGPVGMFEKKLFAKGTIELAQAVVNMSAMTVVGGGDTDAAVRMAGVADRIAYISTGGGAFLEMLEGKPLPGIWVLDS